MKILKSFWSSLIFVLKIYGIFFIICLMPFIIFARMVYDMAKQKPLR